MENEKNNEQGVEVKGYEESEVFYSNQIFFTRITDDDVELAFSLVQPDNKVKVTHRLIITMPHLFRLKEMIVNVTNDLEQQMKLKNSYDEGK